MKIKTYKVNNLTEALAKIKRDLGPEAVVLSTQKVAKEGPWYAKKKEILEVRAALDPSPGILSERSQLKSERELSSRHVNQMTEDLISPLRAEIKQLRSLIQSQQSSHFVERKPQTQTPPAAQFVQESKGEKNNTVYSLIHHGVNLQAVQKLSTYLSDHQEDESQLEERAAEWIYQNVSFADMDEFFESKLILLVGPTGSGKTTTLAKLAAQLKIQFDRKIALVNLDQYRVAASDQLEKYAEILQVPFYNVHSKEELIELKSQLNEFDHILLDTTGRSPFDQEGLLGISEYFAGQEEKIWTALTLPVNLRETDLKENLNRFQLFNYNNLILTKLDETASFGNLFNAPYFSAKPVSFFTMGQNVPDDIELASIEGVLESLFDDGESANQILNLNQEYLKANFLGGTAL